jgi:hypothetical protein
MDFGGKRGAGGDKGDDRQVMEQARGPAHAAGPP